MRFNAHVVIDDNDRLLCHPVNLHVGDIGFQFLPVKNQEVLISCWIDEVFHDFLHVIRKLLYLLVLGRVNRIDEEIYTLLNRCEPSVDIFKLLLLGLMHQHSLVDAVTPKHVILENLESPLAKARSLNGFHPITNRDYNIQIVKE